MAKLTNSTSAFTFPTGKGTAYRNIGITPSSADLTQFNAEYFNSPYSDILTFGSGIAKVSEVDYFILDRVSGTANASVTLSWGSNSGVSNLTDLRVARWNGSEWADEGNTGTTGDVTSGTIISNVITSFSPFALGSSTVQPLPAELTSFTASVIGSKVKLSWQTATEINNYGFEIERALSSTTPLQVWEKIGFVNGNGNSNSQKSYSFTDESISLGKYSYRLKQIDNDGTFEFSSAIEVDLGIPKEFQLSQNYPNPFNPITKIQYALPVDAQVTLQIYSITGELMESLVSENQSPGNYTIDFDGSNYASGTYIYRLVANDYVQTKKMTLIK